MSESVERIRTIVNNMKELYDKGKDNRPENLEIKYLCVYEEGINHEYFTIIHSQNEEDIGMHLKHVLQRELIPDEIQGNIFTDIEEIIKYHHPGYHIQIYKDFQVK